MQVSDPEDMISRLPDNILVSIISLIPTKEALSTRILSKRWTNLFRFVSALTFLSTSCRIHIPCTCDAEGFIDGVHQVLQRHSAFIRSFELRCCSPESCTHTVEQCILSLAKLGIQKLTLCLRHYTKSNVFRLPFSCHLLSRMPSLQYFKFDSGSLLPSLINIPCSNYSLKTLRLVNVCASPGSLECILSNCLSLCTLIVEACEVPSKLCFPRLNLQLKCIVIHYCGDLEEIDFYAPNLTTFDLDCYREVNLIFDSAPQLQTVYICSHTEDVPYFCGRLAKNLPSLKTLLLDGVEDLYQDVSIYMGKNMFCNLKRLELTINEGKSNLFSLIRVVHACPRLEEFQLAVVEISGFGGSESEVGFVAYILRSAVKLQKMIISFYLSEHSGRGGWVEVDFPPTLCKKWSQVYECIQEIKHEAVSNTLQVIAQEFPQRKPKQIF